MSSIFKVLGSAIAGLAATAGYALAQEGAPISVSAPPPTLDAHTHHDFDLEASKPILVEMFLSQACKLSPPAAEVLSAMSKRSDVVALAWHVDYWNSMAASRNGAWADPFSDETFGSRQMTYNERIRGRGTVFTPQAIVNGEVSTVGSSVDALKERVVNARRAAPNHAVRMRLASKPGSSAILVELSSNNAAPFDIMRIDFLPNAKTMVEGGDNAGTVFEEVNVVTSTSFVGRFDSNSGEVEISRPADDHGCAIIAQEPDQGRVLAAHYCP